MNVADGENEVTAWGPVLRITIKQGPKCGKVFTAPNLLRKRAGELSKKRGDSYCAFSTEP